MASIKLDRVTRTFGTKTAVSNISFEVPDREFLVLLGPSGCGKSTLLRMLAGLESVSSGEIHLNQRRVDQLPPSARDMAFVFQSYALYPHMTVRRNITFPLIMRQFKWWFHIPIIGGMAKRKIEASPEVSDLVGRTAKILALSEMMDRFPRTLSGGQRQRVALARSLAKKPQLLLLDEPLGALDKKLREETQIELVNIIEEVGVTCVIVTHDQDEAMTMATRIAVMSEGRLLQVGPPGEVYETPASRFVADFIGNVNLMDGTLAVDEPDHVQIRCDDCMHWVGHGITGTEGMAVSVALRPEKIRLAREPHALPGDAAPAFNRVRGTVRDISYFGSYTVYHLLLASGQVLKVSTSNAERHREHPLTWGDEAWASWSPSAPVVLTQ